MAFTQIKVSNVLSSEQLESLGLSRLELCKFICGMGKILNFATDYHLEITPTDQFIVSSIELYTRIEELDGSFRHNHQQYLDIEDFCRLGELEKVDDMWFYSDFKIFTNLYITENRKIGYRNWNKERIIEAIAWEVYSELGYYYWHYSQMSKAVNYLFPDEFKEPRYIINSLSANLDKFQKAGCNGVWQLTKIGDGCPDNLEAIKRIFREAGTPLTLIEILDKLKERRRCVQEKSIEVLLKREDRLFENLGHGRFRLFDIID